MIHTPLATYIALNKIFNLNTKQLLHLENLHTNITQILRLSNQELSQLGFTEKQLHQWNTLSWHLIEKELNWSSKQNCHIIHWHDSSYPLLLKEIHCPPPILYIQGKLDAIQPQTIAIVGSRHPTEYARQNASFFSQQLSTLGFCIASGLAIGIDGIAHENALTSLSGTIAVVATGLDQIYPQRHTTLARKIVENGAIISEYPFQTPPRPENFPRRNRIISGLSKGVLVIEAALKSGSLITARYAMEQGREVFAIPGIIQNPNTQGCHELIRQGAILVTKIEDILEELGFQIVAKMEESSKKTSSSLLEYFDYGIVTSIDILIARTGLTHAEITTQLFELELSGIISKKQDGYYRNS